MKYGLTKLHHPDELVSPYVTKLHTRWFNFVSSSFFYFNIQQFIQFLIQSVFLLNKSRKTPSIFKWTHMCVWNILLVLRLFTEREGMTKLHHPTLDGLFHKNGAECQFTQLVICVEIRLFKTTPSLDSIHVMFVLTHNRNVNGVYAHHFPHPPVCLPDVETVIFRASPWHLSP